MIHGYHLILPVYGFWLPNDPRGSWSEFVGKWELVRFGRTTKSFSRRELAELSSWELRDREEARASLKYPPVHLTVGQMQSVAEAFAIAGLRNGYTIWACSILPEHVHLVVARHRYKIEQIANLLKGTVTRQLVKEGLHPLIRFASEGQRPPRMWAEHQWKVYLDSEEAIEGAIHYVEQNPEHEGKPRQVWRCVTPFTGILKGGWLAYW